jgi:hypothetical protein
VTIELARTRVTGFPWDLLGVTQVDNIPLARIATFTGVYGVSLEIMIVNAAFAAAFLLRRNRRPLLLAALVAAFVLQGAHWIPAPSIPADHTALLVQENIPVLEGADWTTQYFTDTLTELNRLSLTSMSGQRPALIVWPESPAPFYSGDPLFRTAVTQIAKSAQSWMVVGNVGVENAHASPHRLALVDELLVARGGLISVVGLAAFEDELQRYVKVSVVHRPIVAGASAGRIKHLPRMPGQVFVASGEHLLPVLRRRVLERKIDHMGEHMGSYSKSLPVAPGGRCMSSLCDRQRVLYRLVDLRQNRWRENADRLTHIRLRNGVQALAADGGVYKQA